MVPGDQITTQVMEKKRYSVKAYSELRFSIQMKSVVQNNLKNN